MNVHRDAGSCLTCLAARIALGLVLVFGGISIASAQQQQQEEQQQIESSTEQGATEIDQSDLSGPQPDGTIVRTPSEELAPFWRDSKFSAQARTFYFDRDKYDDTSSEAWAIGGSFTYRSGYLADFLRFGATAYTSQPLYAPDDKDGTLLLQPGQEGYTVLGQWYGEVKFTDRIFGAIGAKEYNTPYINKNDVRMTPNTFEGATIYGTAGGTDGAPEVRFGGGYIAKIKEKNADDFKWMSQSAGATVERGVSVAGANLKYVDFAIGAAEYYSDDIINIFYAESKYALPLGETTRLSFAAQFAEQHSVGDDLLTGASFSTNQWGLKSDLALGPTLLTLAYTDTADGANMRAPWSGYPGYTSVQVKDFNRASERAVLARAAYDFSSIGAPGWSTYVLYVHGSGVESPNYNENETDFNLQWTPKGGALRGLSFRLRYAYIEQRGGGDPNINDLRFIVNYDFPRPGE